MVAGVGLLGYGFMYDPSFRGANNIGLLNVQTGIFLSGVAAFIAGSVFAAAGSVISALHKMKD